MEGRELNYPPARQFDTWQWRYPKDFIYDATNDRFIFVYGTHQNHISDMLVEYDVASDTYRKIADAPPGPNNLHYELYQLTGAPDPSSDDNEYIFYVMLTLREISSNYWVLGTYNPEEAPKEADIEPFIVRYTERTQQWQRLTKREDKVQMAMPYQPYAPAGAPERRDYRTQWVPDTRKGFHVDGTTLHNLQTCLLYTSPSPRD